MQPADVALSGVTEKVKHRSPVLMVGEEVEAAMLLVEILSCWLEN